MKNLIISLCFLSFMFVSCEEDFDPKTDYKPKYIMSCIIRGDTTYQTLTLSKSYMVEGHDPYENNTSPFISGADVRLWQKDSVYFFRDSSIEQSSSRYNTPVDFYYINNFRPAENIPLEIRVIFPNGKALTATTVLPKKIKWDHSSDFSLPAEGKNNFTFRWIPENDYGWYLMKYYIVYKNTYENNNLILRKEVPLKYNGNTPEYPKPTKNNAYIFEKEALDKAFSEISLVDTNKSHYLIFGGVIEMLVFDQHLSKYYSSINGFIDDFTVRVDQTDYTNVEGGLGIFGSYIKQPGGSSFKKEYIDSFRYRLNK